MSKSRIFIYTILIVVAISAIFIFNYNNNKPAVDIALSDLDIIYGSDSASLSIILYSSYNCIFCRKFFNETYPQLKSEYIDNNKVKLIVKLVELTNDERMFNGLKTAICINKYGNFEKLNKLLLTDPKVVYTKEFNEVVEEFIEKDSFVAECMINGEAEDYLLANKTKFGESGLTGTPTFIINKNVYKGNKDYISFKKIIEKELRNILQ